MAHDRSEKASGPTPAAQTKAAEQGVGKATGVLPHLDQIQAAFGHHDVRGIGAEVGGDAAAAALTVGAHAYAYGDRIAFASAPDLHTAAHEAAHVIQQRAGVAVPGGIGTTGDIYERHADRVADAVVAGQSAEALLDEIAPRPSARGTGAPAIQRKDAPVYINAYSYMKGHAREIQDVIGKHLSAVALPTGHARMIWKDDKAFYAKLREELKRLLGAEFKDAEANRSVLKPHDPYEVIDDMRPIAGIEKPLAGEPTIGGKVGLPKYRESIAVAIAQLFEGAIVQSLNRLGPRWLAAADQAAGGSGKAHGVLSLNASIAMSHHMDRAVLPAMMEPGVFEVRAESKKETAERVKDEATGKAVKTPPGPGTRKLDKKDVEYLGDKDRLMWNWVRIKSPADVTVEEVADYLFGYAAGNYGEKNGTFFAYGLTASPPFFGIPGAWARRIPECNANAPAAADKDQTGHEHNLQLAGGSVTDELALIEQARHKPAPSKPGDPVEAPPTVVDIGELIDDLSTQANTVKGVLSPWKLGGPVDKALVFIGRKLSEIKTPADAAKWKPVLAAQKETLKTIGGAVVALDATATQIGIKKSGAEAGQLRDIMMVYADAAASSHLADTSARLIAEAGAMQSRLSLAAIESTTRAMASSVDTLNESSHSTEQGLLNRRAVELEADSKAMQSKLLRGEQVSSEEIENHTLSANILSLRAKTEATLVALRQLRTAAHDARDGAAHEIAAWFSGDFRELEPSTLSLESDLMATISDMDFAVQAETMSIRDPEEYRKAHHAAYKSAYEKANKRFESLRNHAVGEKSLKDWLSDGEKLIRRQELRAAIVKMAALLGISLIGGALGGVVTRMVAGVWGRFASAGLAELSMAGRMVSVGSGMAVDSLVGAAGQSAIYNESFAGNYAEHMLTAIGTHGVLSSLGAISHQMAQLKQSRKLLAEVNAMESAGNELAAVEKTLEKVTPGKWKGRAMFVLNEGAKITGHAVMGAGLTYVAHRLVSGEHGEIPMTTLEEWAMQGSSVFVGRYVGHAMQHHMGAHKKLASIPDFEPGKRLLSESVELQKMADTLADENKPHNASTALEVLAKRHRVLLDEIDALEQISRSKKLMAKYGVDEHGIHNMQRELHQQLDEAHAQGFEDISLHLAGLDELVPGAVWKGSRDNIEAAIRAAERSGVDVVAKRNAATGEWSVTLNGRPLKIEEHAAPGHATTSKPGSGGGGDHAPPGGGPGAGGPSSGEAQADPNLADRALVTRAVPGSEFRGIEPGKPVGSVKDQAQRGFVIAQEANYKMLGLTDVVPGVRTIQRSAAGGYVVTLTDGARFGVEVVAAPLDGQTVARAIVNPTKPGRIKVLGGELDVQGRHVIQLSTTMSLAQVERAIASQLGVIATAHSEMIRGRHDGPSALGGNGSNSRLGALDTGRAAEINMLSRQIHERPAEAVALRSELAALVEHLGIRKGAVDGDARWGLLEPELTPQARDEMAKARRDEGEYSNAERDALRKLRDKAYDDLDGQMKPGGGANDVHALPQPLAAPGKVADRARIAEAARMAMEFRAMKSERTLRSYRDRARALGSGEYVKVADLQIGGGAALAARRPSALLIDQRGRWQADAGSEIAQTAQQIRMLREAGIGDPREVAGPGERIPLDAIRYWEDSIAAQGEVIDGAAAFRTGSKGEMLLDITPTDGSGRVTIEVTGTPTIATGFPTERAPGAARGITIVDSVLMLEHRLRVIADDAQVSQRTKLAVLQAADTLKSLDGGEAILTAAQAQRALDWAMRDPNVRAELQPLLAHDKNDVAKTRGPTINDALQTVKASSEWQDQKNSDAGQQSLFLGDEANLWTIKKLVAPDNREAPKHIVVAGTGGTAISAVEIILASNPNVKVTMLGRDTPAGLAGNDQFRQVAKKHLDHEDAAKLGLPGGTVDERLRMVIDKDMSLGAPEPGAVDTQQVWTAYTDPKTGTRYTGDAYISALGRENQVPPIVSEMIMRARLQGGDDAVKFKPLFDGSQRFTGYQIAITIGKKTHFVEVTGSVSRFAPRGAGMPDNAGFRGDDQARIDRASRVDAHPNSGGFDAGYGATADQSSAYARDRVARESKKP